MALGIPTVEEMAKTPAKAAAQSSDEVSPNGTPSAAPRSSASAALLARAYTELPLTPIPGPFRARMRKAAEEHEGFWPEDIRVVQTQDVGKMCCYLAVCGSDATAGAETEGVFAVFA